jgi:hypothetical protein
VVRLSALRTSLPRSASASLVVSDLQEVDTPELAAELYRRLCMGSDDQPGPYSGTVLDLYLESLREEPTNRGP